MIVPCIDAIYDSSDIHMHDIYLTVYIDGSLCTHAVHNLLKHVAQLDAYVHDPSERAADALAAFIDKLYDVERGIMQAVPFVYCVSFSMGSSRDAPKRSSSSSSSDDDDDLDNISRTKCFIMRITCCTGDRGDAIVDWFDWNISTRAPQNSRTAIIDTAIRNALTDHLDVVVDGLMLGVVLNNGQVHIRNTLTARHRYRIPPLNSAHCNALDAERYFGPRITICFYTNHYRMLDNILSDDEEDI